MTAPSVPLHEVARRMEAGNHVVKEGERVKSFHSPQDLRLMGHRELASLVEEHTPNALRMHWGLPLRGDPTKLANDPVLGEYAKKFKAAHAADVARQVDEARMRGETRKAPVRRPRAEGSGEGGVLLVHEPEQKWADEEGNTPQHKFLKDARLGKANPERAKQLWKGLFERAVAPYKGSSNYDLIEPFAHDEWARALKDAKSPAHFEQLAVARIKDALHDLADETE